jgi:Flp pilus assembly protein TadD
LPSGGLLAACALALMTGCASNGPAVSASGAAPAEYPAAVLDRYDRALDMMGAGEDDPAARELNALAQSHPDYAGPLVNLAIIRARNGDPGEATRLLQLAVTVCADCAPAWNQLGILYRQSGDFEAAERAYRAALDADADYALAHYNLGLLYDLYQSRPELALDHYERCLALTDDVDLAAEVTVWVADLRRRIAAAPHAVTGGAS